MMSDVGPTVTLNLKNIYHAYSSPNVRLLGKHKSDFTRKDMNLMAKATAMEGILLKNSVSAATTPRNAYLKPVPPQIPPKTTPTSPK